MSLQSAERVSFEAVKGDGDDLSALVVSREKLLTGGAFDVGEGGCMSQVTPWALSMSPSESYQISMSAQVEARALAIAAGSASEVSAKATGVVDHSDCTINLLAHEGTA